VIVVAGILAAGLGIASVWMLPRFRSAAPLHPLRVSVNPPPGGEFRLESGSEMSPDGRLIVYVAHTGDADRLWLRPLDELSARELPGTEGATYPFWSPDSRSIGFFAAGKLKRVDVGGGSPAELCAVTGGRGGTWSANGVILFNGYNDGPIMQVSGVRRRTGRGDDYRPVAQRELTPLAAVPSRRPTISVLCSGRQSAGPRRLRERA